ncbi:MAG: DUF6873 family GME fold protein [Eubacteriales bacterium]
MVVFRTWKDGQFVRPYLFLSKRAATSIGNAKELAEITLVPLPSFDRLPAPVSDHPDMLIFPVKGGRQLILYEGYYQSNRTLFDSLPFLIDTIPDPILPVYPHDIKLNYLAVGDRLIGRTDLVHPKLTEGRIFIKVRQGYARCSVCRVGKSAAITADPSIKQALISMGMEVLTIRPGHIHLEGYDYGFIGGASFGIGRQICFFGDLSRHPDGAAMDAFIRKQGYTAVNLLPEKELSDFGGGLFID